jgi:tetratricopeptide (TPR) repeat protein
LSDAGALARRGTAFAARHDYQHALADLTRACELAPGVATYFYERGLVHGQNEEPDLALADFDQAIKLKPDDVPSLIARATLRAQRHDPPAAVTADLDAADRAAPKEAGERLHMGALYQSAGEFAAAVAQYSKWIDGHPREDVHMGAALNARCWARALWGQELDAALADCNEALGRYPHEAPLHATRALVYLRRGNYDKAIADYDEALQRQPKIAWALYGRGVARLRKGLTATGNADILAAVALQPKIAEEASGHGINP